jgi:anti-sigma B factor antagonist
LTPERLASPDAGAAVVVSLAGELDIGTVESICARGATALDQPGARTLIFDLAAVTYIDSTAIGALVDVRRAAAARHVPMRLAHVSSSVQRVLEISGLAEYLGATRGPGG